MSEKRRDNKGRVLRTGEQQRKDGRYLFCYVGADGKSHYIYSWTLEPTDKTPAGKKKSQCLRDLEKQVKKDIEDKVAYHGDDMTVLELMEKYLSTKTGVKSSTKTGYKTTMNIMRKEEFSTRRIDTVKISDAKLFLIKLQQEDKRSFSSIHCIRGVLRTAFQMAVDDDLIRKNPFEFQMVDVIVDDSIKREAISRDDERRYLEFIKKDEHYSRYYDAIYILFHTGLRISEWCGLTLSDIDMTERTITIDHQLRRGSDMVYEMVPSPKTESGNRTIPMTQEVYECFKRILKKRNPKVEPVLKDIMGRSYSRFLHLDKNNMPMVALHWEKYFQLSVAKHNRIYKYQLPKITPHIARHTYCTNMAKSGMNPKTLQYLMGHSEIGVTLDTYTHIKYEDAKEEVERMDGLAKAN